MHPRGFALAEPVDDALEDEPVDDACEEDVEAEPLREVVPEAAVDVNAPEPRVEDVALVEPPGAAFERDAPDPAPALLWPPLALEAFPPLEPSPGLDCPAPVPHAASAVTTAMAAILSVILAVALRIPAVLLARPWLEAPALLPQ